MVQYHLNRIVDTIGLGHIQVWAKYAKTLVTPAEAVTLLRP